MSQKIAFLFPGQASQYVGMGKDLYEKNSLAKEYFDNACDILGYDIKKICFEGPEEELKQTRITQPAIFIHSSIVAALLNEIKPSMSAGHSLGEYSAVTAAKSIPFRILKPSQKVSYPSSKVRGLPYWLIHQRIVAYIQAAPECRKHTRQSLPALEFDNMIYSAHPIAPVKYSV